MGPSSVDPALRVLDPGESVKTPETHILCMKSDLDHVTQALLDHVRRDVLPRPPSDHVFDVEGVIAATSSTTKPRRALTARSTWPPILVPRHL